MTDALTRQPAVAGRWYPDSPAALAAMVDTFVAAAGERRFRAPVALVAPHAGLMYSGAIAAQAYAQAPPGIEVVVLVGPSHYVAFEGAAVYPSGFFQTPLGAVQIDAAVAERLLAAAPMIREDVGVHGREHSLEMQLPFIRRLLPETRMVPVLMGDQTAEAAAALGAALAEACAGERVLLVASTDLSHYHERSVARRLDAAVIDCVERFDADGLQALLDGNSDHACGGGPVVAVMRAARALGATDAAILGYGDSADVSGDTSAVVGYLAAAMGKA